MNRTRVIRKLGSLLVILCSSSSHASIFGEETPILLQMVSNQVQELSKLAESIGVAKDQTALLTQINEGIEKASRQISSIESIIERAQGIDPTAIHDLSKLNEAIDTVKGLSKDTQELVLVKLMLCDQAEEQAGMQSDTAYKMGQEMAALGQKLAEESKNASPGRAQQISASASSAQMLGMGVELQTLAQISQLLALSLDLQKTQIQKGVSFERNKRSYMKYFLSGKTDFGNTTEKPKIERKQRSR